MIYEMCHRKQGGNMKAKEMILNLAFTLLDAKRQRRRTIEMYGGFDNLHENFEVAMDIEIQLLESLFRVQKEIYRRNLFPKVKYNDKTK